MGQPKTTPLVERRHAFGFLVGEVNNGQFSREQITLAAGADVCTAGLVLAYAVGAATVTAKAGEVGNGVISAVVVGPAAKTGDYKLTIIEPATNAGAFMLEDPDGVDCGTGVVGVAFTAGGLTFTLADGASDFVAGDQLTITVAAGLGYLPFNPTSPGHLQSQLAVLGSEHKDATTVAQPAAAVVRGPCKINSDELIWGDGVTTDAQKAAALARLKRQGVVCVHG